MAEEHSLERKHSLRRVPVRYFLFTLLAAFECILYLYSWHVLPDDGAGWALAADSVAVESVHSEGPAARAGLKTGDTILAINRRQAFNYFSTSSLDIFPPGSTVQYEILRNGTRRTISVTLASIFAGDVSFYWLYYFLIAVVFFIGVFVFLKKPDDSSVRVFFVFSQIFCICLNGEIASGGQFALIRTAVFVFTFPFLGTTLFHFFLLFPEKRNFQAGRRLSILSLFYIISFLAGAALVTVFARLISRPTENRSADVVLAMRIALPWMGFTLLTAMGAAVKKFFSIREVVAHNQMRWVAIGLVVGLLPETVFGFYPNILWSLQPYFPDIGEISWALGAIVMLSTFSFALLRYRLWDIEIFIKRSLLYAGVTLSVTVVYFVSVYLVENFVSVFFISAQAAGIIVSVLLFLPIREVIQKRVDKTFHRENYNATTAAFEFEHRLGGIYQSDLLCTEIVKQLDGIFHFQSLEFFLKSGDRSYTATDVSGTAISPAPVQYAPAEEFTGFVLKGKPFALRELSSSDNELEHAGTEIIVPILYGKSAVGFFACGAKRSEKIYSAEDIQLLLLLARRTSALLHTAELYRNELERRTMLERERARISKDMHDEVGAALTKISVMSELAEHDVKRSAAKQSLKKISTTARDVSQSLDELVWAMNPRYDSLEDLVAYLREYVVEFCSTAHLRCRADVPEDVHQLPLSAEVRRTIFLVVKESVNNIVKHARATEAVFSIRAAGKHLTITIQDNGKGMAAAKRSGSKGFPSGSNGLQNMTERMKSIGGECLITSSPRHGTEVKLHIPMNG